MLNPIEEKGMGDSRLGEYMAKRKRSLRLVAYFTTRNGRRIYASEYGYKAWPIGSAK